jgi:hypothetical protein
MIEDYESILIPLSHPPAQQKCPSMNVSSLKQAFVKMIFNSRMRPLLNDEDSPMN